MVPVPAKGRSRVLPEDDDPIDAAEATPDRSGPADAWEQAIATIVAWVQGSGPPVWLVEGPAGTGKTRLIADVAGQLSDTVQCGWARPGMAVYAVTAAARDGRSALLLVDDADTRADLLAVLDALTDLPAGIRVIITARDFGGWWTDLLARLPVRQGDQLAAGRVVMGYRDGTAASSPSSPSEGGGGVGDIAVSPDRALAAREVRLAPADPRGRAVSTLASADPGSAHVLLRQAAVVVALSTREGQLDPAAVRCALRDLFEEDGGYWRRALAEVTIAGAPTPALRSALTSAAVVGDDGLVEAATVLRRVPALAVGAADRLARMAVWWHGLYARLGASAVPIPRLPSWFADRVPDGTDSSGISWTVATLDAERRATATLSRMAVDAHRDVWPVAASRSTDLATQQAAEAHDSLRRAVAAVGPVDEALAWLTEELDLDDQQLAALAETVGYPSRDLGRTGIVLTRRLLAAAEDGYLEGDPAAEQRRATLTVGLGARYCEVGRWDDARRHTEQAVHIFHRLVLLDRDRYLPDLAGAVANLASCLAQLGEREEALTQSYEAVTLYRELVAAAGVAGPGVARPGVAGPTGAPGADGGAAGDGLGVGGGGFGGGFGEGARRHMPELARALSNLTACLSRAGRRSAALGAAGQSVTLYRELASHDPQRYATELASAEHNWRVCRGVLGEPIAGAGLPA